ncbi:unnamed protein product [Larinioides sclopetarius]|uniref:Granulin n=1 Tax=Larinioides sclopetarius TaxID=280406 RepID=A0AAV2A718_9ARAC
MKAFVLLVFIPSFITADILCPNSKTTCPKDKKCCEVDGEYSCCDLDVDLEEPARRLKVYAGVEYMSSVPFAHLSHSSNESKLQYGVCSPLNCDGTCCDDFSYSCCPYISGTCCDDDKCCPYLTKCCNDGGCCKLNYECCGAKCCASLRKCCGEHCCGITQSCCGDGCCGTLQKCCGNGCCDYGYNCCESWCCKEGSRCGPNKTCVSKGAAVSPEFVALLWMAASVFISYRL